MNVRMLLVVWAVVVFVATASKSQSLQNDPGLPDSVLVDSVIAFTTGSGVVPINFSNDESLAGIEVTLIWNSPDVIVDSFSFVGSRVEYTSLKNMTSSDSTVTIYCFPFSGEQLIPPGKGLFGQLFFSFPPTTAAQVVVIDTITLAFGNREYATTFSDSAALAFNPQYRKGYLDIQDTVCCIADRGNIDGTPDDVVNVADLTYLVAYLFQGGPAPPCHEEANIDGSADGAVNVADLTYVVSYLFQGGPPPAPCP